MKISVLTMFPELFESFLAGPIVQRARQRDIARIELVDIREYAGGCYRHIDDSTFGGGAGMILRAQPVLNALRAARQETQETENTVSAGKPSEEESHGAEDTEQGCQGQSVLTVALTPVGGRYHQRTAQRYASLTQLILICGHYEGMDERIYRQVDERVSIGDYVLSGGEIAAQVVIDSVLRLLPGVLRAQSTAEESFCGRGFLEYPQYTRPADLDGDRVPDILLTGNHEEIRRWRLKESLRATLRFRPELLEQAELTREERELLGELKME